MVFQTKGKPSQQKCNFHRPEKLVKMTRMFMRWSPRSKRFVLPFERMSTWEALGNPLHYKGEKPTVSLKRTTIVVTRRKIWKLQSKLTTGSASNTSLKNPAATSVEQSWSPQGPGDFHSSGMFPFQDEYLDFHHRNVSAFGRSQPIPQPSWVRLWSFLGVSLQGDPRWSEATRGGGPHRHLGSSGRTE